MKREFCRKLTFVVSCSILVFSILGVMLVFATASEGNHKHVTVNGKDYEYFADIKEGYKSLRAGTYIGLTKGSPQAGLMAALPRVYDSNGYLYASAKEWEYSGPKTVGMNVPIFAEHNGSYYSHGKVNIYNGNGYNTYYTYKSPIMTLRDGRKPLSLYITTEHIDDSGYEVNSNGETYGSGSKEAILGVAPDLIKARGVDGTLGYVRSEDIEPEAAENPEEAVKMMERQKSDDVKIVPLYKVDGKTIIGEFKLETISEKDIIKIEEK